MNINDILYNKIDREKKRKKKWKRIQQYLEMLIFSWFLFHRMHLKVLVMKSWITLLITKKKKQTNKLTWINELDYIRNKKSNKQTKCKINHIRPPVHGSLPKIWCSSFPKIILTKLLLFLLTTSHNFCEIQMYVCTLVAFFYLEVSVILWINRHLEILLLIFYFFVKFLWHSM